MKILFYIILVILVVLFIPFLLYGLSDFTGIGKKEGGYKIYNVNSPLKEGKEFIKRNKIKCVGKDVDMIAFMDIGRKEVFFAYNVDYADYYFVEKINYETVPDEIVKKYDLSPRFTWLERNGKKIDNWMTVVILGGALVFFLITRAWR